MRARLSLLSALLMLVVVVGSQMGRGAAGSKEATPPTAKELVGVWLGFDSDQLTFTRLDLPFPYVHPWLLYFIGSSVSEVCPCRLIQSRRWGCWAREGWGTGSRM